MDYIREFIAVIIRHRLAWWVPPALAILFGFGVAEDYLKVRQALLPWWPTLPTDFPGTLVTILILLWLVFSLIHKETLRQLRAGRVVLEEPQILEDVPLYEKIAIAGGEMMASRQVTTNDILYVQVKNEPYDITNGEKMDRTYGSVIVTDLSSSKEILRFDYPRWMENEKPGYSGNPSDRFLDDWRYRTLHPNASRNRLDLVVKSIDEDNAYGFSGSSQLKGNWHEPSLAIPRGRYRLDLILSWNGMREPYKASYEFINNGSQQRMTIRRTDKGLSTQWIPAKQ